MLKPRNKVFSTLQALSSLNTGEIMNTDTLPKFLGTAAEKNQIIQSRITEGLLLLSNLKDSQHQLGTALRECENWSNYNEKLLSRLFDNKEIVDKYTKFSGEIPWIPYTSQPTASEKFDIFQKRFENSINSLVEMCDQIEIPKETLDEIDKESLQIPSHTFGDKIFIVHGHNEAAKLKMARFVDSLELIPIILDEQPSRGQTIIDKFEEHADQVGFAIVLLTCDDVGAPKERLENPEPRARQNVILELGYFLCGLGRERVRILYEEGVELPSDVYGLSYVPMDKSAGWKLELAKEMASVGIPIDLNKLVQKK